MNVAIWETGTGDDAVSLLCRFKLNLNLKKNGTSGVYLFELTRVLNYSGSTSTVTVFVYLFKVTGVPSYSTDTGGVFSLFSNSKRTQLHRCDVDAYPGLEQCLAEPLFLSTTSSVLT